MSQRQITRYCFPLLSQRLSKYQWFCCLLTYLLTFGRHNRLCNAKKLENELTSPPWSLKKSTLWLMDIRCFLHSKQRQPRLSANPSTIHRRSRQAIRLRYCTILFSDCLPLPWTRIDCRWKSGMTLIRQTLEPGRDSPLKRRWRGCGQDQEPDP